VGKVGEAEVAQRIGESLARMMGGYYGQAPARQVTHVLPGLVVVVLEETFTEAERVLIGRGEAEGVADIRRRFQKAVEQEFRAVVEEATGTEVRAFISDVHLEANLSVEIFLLGDVKENMTGFEREMRREETAERKQEREQRES
jgi:uncharacterized protein YbcI